MYPIEGKLMEKIEYLATPDREIRFHRLKELINRPFRIEADDSDFVRNIIIPAEIKNTKTVLTAHWDTFPYSSGLNDNATGLAILLQIQNDLPPHVEMVFTDGEEFGGAGSSHYIRNHKDEIKNNINLDVCGVGDFIYLENYLDDNIHFPKNERVIDVEGIPFNDSHIFKESGIPSILIMAGNGKEDFLSEIWDHQHGNSRDGDITLLNPEIMAMICVSLKNSLYFNKPSIK